MSQDLINADRHVRGKAVAVVLASARSLVMLGDLAQRTLTSAGTAIATMIVVMTAAAIARLLAYATIRLGRLHVERGLSVRTSVERIVPFINDLRRLDTSPPSVMVDAIRGEPVTGTGTHHRPAGGGTDRIEIINADPLSGFLVRLIMADPLAALSRLALTLEPQGDTVRVTWTITGEASLLGKILRLILDVDAMIGRTFEAYLSDLKIMVE